MKQINIALPTEQDIKSAMIQARERIEGKDWKNKDSEGHKRWHQELTEAFILKAWNIGGVRPSDLLPDQREAFIRWCKRVRIIDLGPRISLA